MHQLVLQIIFMGLECLQPSGIQPKSIFVLQLPDKTRGKWEKECKLRCCLGQRQIFHRRWRCQTGYESDPSHPEPSSGPICALFIIQLFSSNPILSLKSLSSRELSMTNLVRLSSEQSLLWPTQGIYIALHLGWFYYSCRLSWASLYLSTLLDTLLD